jgi:hypothetical protein
MANTGVGTRVIARDCSICRAAEAVVRSIITEPLVSSVDTYVCLDCYPINKAAADSLLAADPRLVLVEVKA